MRAMQSNPSPETIAELLRRYLDERTYSFAGLTVLSVNTKGKELETPLHVAATRGAIKDVLLLIRNGAEVDAKDEIGMTPLHRAACGKSVDVVKALLDAGAAIRTATMHGETAESLADCSNDRAVYNYLISRMIN